jgi:hypothetical protein
MRAAWIRLAHRSYPVKRRHGSSQMRRISTDYLCQSVASATIRGELFSHWRVSHISSIMGKVIPMNEQSATDLSLQQFFKSSYNNN